MASALASSLLLGCSAKPIAPPLVAPPAARAPAKVVVSDFSGDPEPATLARDALARGLAGLGFSVLTSQGRLGPATRSIPLDWVFLGEVDASGELHIRLRGLRPGRAVWAIVDARAEGADDVESRVAEALRKFEQDVLGRREENR